MKTCSRCPFGMTALWQVGFNIAPSGYQGIFRVWSSMLVCGICAEDVKLSDFDEDVDRILSELTYGHEDARHLFSIELQLDDISDGMWHDPRLMTPDRVPV